MAERTTQNGAAARARAASDPREPERDTAREADRANGTAADRVAGDALRSARRGAAATTALDGRYAPIESYGIIGDLQTIALVGLDGSIDFCCFPRFDSPSVFAALLDADRGGRFSIDAQLEGARHKQLYLPDTNVLLTRFLSAQAVVEIVDYMPIHDEVHSSRIVRHVKVIRGAATLRVTCSPRLDYARTLPAVQVKSPAAGDSGSGAAGVATFNDGARDHLRLWSSVPLGVDEHDAVAEFSLEKGQTATFILEHVPESDDPDELDPRADAPGYASRAFDATVAYWRHWLGASTYRGHWRDEVHRSALALKLLHCRRSGAIVAAGTFGLPETVGGVRNWDYRYTWIRDASFTLYALIRLGLTEETRDFIQWLVARAGLTDDPGALQTLYSIDGATDLPEVELDHLEGYRKSAPVRVGNAAADQLQLDIYGELIDALYLYDKYREVTSWKLWRKIAAIVDWVCDHWHLPDEGIWEPRAERREHLYSRVMCWVAIDRGIRLATKRSFPAPIERWRAARDAIYADVHTNFWSETKQAFVGARGLESMDAACLIMPLVRFISPTDPRWLSTLAAVERELVDDSLVYRYETSGDLDDGLDGVEGTFSICSFWYAECLSRAGQLDKARFVFEKLLGYASHVGLYAEEIGPAGEHLGNFPQAFTHLALISAAFDLDRRLSDAGWTV